MMLEDRYLIWRLKRDDPLALCRIHNRYETDLLTLGRHTGRYLSTASVGQFLAQLAEHVIRMLAEVCLLGPLRNEYQVPRDVRISHNSEYIVLNWPYIAKTQEAGLPGERDVGEVPKELVDSAFFIRVVEPLLVVLELGVLRCKRLSLTLEP